MPPPISGRLAALNAAYMSTRRNTRPIAPIGSGLREEKDLPMRGDRLVFTGFVYVWSSPWAGVLVESVITDTSAAG